MQTSSTCGAGGRSVHSSGPSWKSVYHASDGCGEGEEPEMNPRLKTLAIPVLRWVLALVLLLESAHFAISPAAARQLAAIGLPQCTAPALGGSEAVAALLFL